MTIATKEIWTLLILDRHCDPEVLLFKERAEAEIEAVQRADKYWGGYEYERPDPILNGTSLVIRYKDVGSMVVQKKAVI